MSITAASGFTAYGVHGGIKPGGDLDTAVVVADRPVPAAAVFTTSQTAAPPVTLARRHLVDPYVRAVIVNSGCANAGTGTSGLGAAEQLAAGTAELIGCPPDQVVVASTGPIGTNLPVANVLNVLPDALAAAQASSYNATLAARAIMTTDTVPKEAVAQGSGYVVGGMAKGAGMVRPDMATMLAYLTTDAALEPAEMPGLLSGAVDATFNALNIDGCQSTNDMVMLLASGDAGVRPDGVEFMRVLTEVCSDLTWQMAKDAEGASRAVTLRVSGAPDERAARAIGRAVADSALVRSSFFGADPNWGRLLAAVGVTAYPVTESDIEVSYNGVTVAAGGIGVPFDETAVIASLEEGDFDVAIVVGSGPGTATVITTDLTPEYVAFNSERS